MGCRWLRDGSSRRLVPCSCERWRRRRMRCSDVRAGRMPVATRAGRLRKPACAVRAPVGESAVRASAHAMAMTATRARILSSAGRMPWACSRRGRWRRASAATNSTTARSLSPLTRVNSTASPGTGPARDRQPSLASSPAPGRSGTRSWFTAMRRRWRMRRSRQDGRMRGMEESRSRRQEVGGGGFRPAACPIGSTRGPAGHWTRRDVQRGRAPSRLSHYLVDRGGCPGSHGGVAGDPGLSL